MTNIYPERKYLHKQTKNKTKTIVFGSPPPYIFSEDKNIASLIKENSREENFEMLPFHRICE